MDIFTWIAALLLGGTTLISILYPLWKQTRPEAIFAVDHSAQTLEEQQAHYASALTAIKDLKFDYEMGKVAEEDYQTILYKSRLEAAKIRQKIDHLLDPTLDLYPTPMEAKIETIITKLRNSNVDDEDKPLSQEVDDEIEQLKQLDFASEDNGYLCPKCGKIVQEGDGFCGSCGQELDSDGCPKCGQPVQEGDGFCAKCGTVLTSLASAFLLLLLSSLLFFVTPGLILAAPPAQAPDTNPSVIGGLGLWAKNCLPCHGLSGKGDGPTAAEIKNPDPLPDFSNPESSRLLVPAENFNTIKNGRIDKLMPPWSKSLSDAQIWDAAAYVWSLSIKPQDLSAGEAIYLEQCASCHAQEGTGDGKIINFTNLETMTQRSQAMMQASFKKGDAHSQLDTISDTELWQTLDYIRTFSYVVPQRNGVITGQVVNGSDNQPLGDVKLILRSFQNKTEIETFTTQADSSGYYTFTNLLTDNSILYIAESNYNGITYESAEPATLSPDSPATVSELKVYNVADNPDSLSISQLHLLMFFNTGSVDIMQIFVVDNNGDQTYLNKDGQSFAFSLPDGATDVIFQNDPSGTRFTPKGNGYVDNTPVVPGLESLNILTQYFLSLDGDSLSIDIPVPIDADSVSILMSQQGADLKSERLKFVNTRQMNNKTFEIFSGSDFKAGETVKVELSGLNKLDFTGSAVPNGATATSAVLDQAMVSYIIMGIGGLLVVLAGVVYPYYRPSQSIHQPKQNEEPAAYRQRLLLTIARLDESFASGELDETVYRQSRADYKARLVEVMEG